ncbi:MAG: IPT/TIG domain-containing protein, partial [Actinomycetota bacterium]|nr:IPT/TIG domain-containing protein [Actinomycetota bacterium]
MATAGAALPTAPASAWSPPSPWITAITPSHGPAAGGNEIVLTGENLEYLESSLQFGIEYGQVLSKTSTTATVRVPRGLSGTTIDVGSGYDRWYPKPNGNAGDDYTYDGRTRHALVASPTHGSPLGGTLVTITGDGVAFKGTKSVTIGGAAAEIVSSTSTSVTIKAPPGEPGSHGI